MARPNRSPGPAGSRHTDRDKESAVAKAVIAGCVCAVVAGGLNPIDVAKIRIQNQPTQGGSYTGMISGIAKIFREEGWRGLGKGLEASMLREVTYSSVRIGGYEPIRKLLSSDLEDPTNSSPLVKLFSALLSGGIGSALCNPFDLVKTRVQAVLPGEPAPYRSTFSAFSTIAKAEGIQGLYRGWVVTCARSAVLTSAQLGSYDSIKHNLLMNVFGIEDGFRLHLGAAMSAGLITTTAANPFDVIKTRYLSDRDHRYRSVLDCVRSTYQTEGIRGFFKGWVPAYWRLGPHTVLAFLLIEEVRTWLGMSTI